jgi:hypothetical protein
MPFTQSDIERIITTHLAELRMPGVLTVRPGFEVTNGWLTGHRAIVATVDQGYPNGADPLPTTIAGVAVDVRRASAAKRQRVMDPDAYASSGRVTPDTGAVPEFDFELDLVSSDEPRPLAESAIPAAVKPNLPYTAPTGVSLSPITGMTTIRLSASPDSGWPTLKAFLEATGSQLTVGMYDITSAHILAELENDLVGKLFTLTLDHPAKNPSADQTDEQSVAALRSALGADFAQAWALERMDPLATAWIFPTAYHIKVAVQDSKTVWLSSGNWNNSNQPAIDPVNVPGDADAARSGDRDWHVVVDRPDLAGTFEAYLLNDFHIAAQNNGTSTSAPAEIEETPQAVTPPFAQFFPAQTLTAEMEITPLLTPDPGVYVDAVKSLIAGAQTSLHMQFQYVEQPKAGATASGPFVDLVNAVIARQKAGVDVKIIMSEYETAGYLEQLQAAGLDVVNSVKIQNNVHNKGIVVDGAAVLVSSQNWSSDGTLFNRDAGVIIRNDQAAAYFDQIFLHDWAHLAAQQTAAD